jgi:hypothetical protein
MKVISDISKLKATEILFQQWNYNIFLVVDIMVRDANNVN